MLIVIFVIKNITVAKEGAIAFGIGIDKGGILQIFAIGEWSPQPLRCSCEHLQAICGSNHWPEVILPTSIEWGEE